MKYISIGIRSIFLLCFFIRRQCVAMHWSRHVDFGFKEMTQRSTVGFNNILCRVDDTYNRLYRHYTTVDDQQWAAVVVSVTNCEYCWGDGDWIRFKCFRLSDSSKNSCKCLRSRLIVSQLDQSLKAVFLGQCYTSKVARHCLLWFEQVDHACTCMSRSLEKNSCWAIRSSSRL